jgi:hypothetical protein
MTNSFRSATVQPITDNFGAAKLMFSHRSLEAPIIFDPAYPGDLTPAAAACYSDGQDVTSGTMGNDLIDALISQQDVSENQANWISDSWDYHSMQKDPGVMVGPIQSA